MNKMHKSYTYILLLLTAILYGCSDNDATNPAPGLSDARELDGIQAEIVGGNTDAMTRAGTVTTLVDYVGRHQFVPNDEVVFTRISRTEAPILQFTYSGITFKAGNENAWSRDDSGPDRVYWTDAQSDHTFIAYSIPQAAGFDWHSYTFEQDGSTKTWYIGSLGNPLAEGDIDYSLTAEEQAAEAETVGGKPVYRNHKLNNEDLLIAYDTEMQAMTGGSVALVRLYHALSSIRVVVNISGFSSTASDHATVVSNMRLLHQPTMYIWMQGDAGTQPLRPLEGSTVTLDQSVVNAAWGGSEAPAYDQRKDLKLWIPLPAGSGTEQSKTFTFYGITTPQPGEYMRTLDADSDYRKAELEFDVTYPNPLLPTQTVTKTYKASLKDVFFKPGFNTTIHVALNHENEQITIGAEYVNWQFVATPDVGQLKKNSTFLQDTERTSVYLAGIDEKATIDDATWLYEMNGNLYDVYGHTGTIDDPFQISTAYQLLSFAYEVKAGNGGAGRDFTGKYIRLDADLTLQPTSDKYKEEIVDNGDNETQISKATSALEWIGIGDAIHPFNGTFIGGDRFIYRLKGSPLFAALGQDARVEELQVNAITIGNGSYTAVTGNGLFAESNAGLICGCRVVGDVSLSGTAAGAFVGQNTGTLYVCYHVGDTQGAGLTGGLVGSNSGIIEGCYQAGAVTGTTTGGITGSNTGTLDNNYYNSDMLTPDYSPSEGVEGRTSTQMTKQAFVTDINNGITAWRNAHPDMYDNYQYIYQPANYPKLP